MREALGGREMQSVMFFGSGQPGEFFLCGGNGLQRALNSVSVRDDLDIRQFLVELKRQFVSDGSARIDIMGASIAGGPEGDELHDAIASITETAVFIPAAVVPEAAPGPSEAQGLDLVMQQYFYIDKLRAWADPYTRFVKVCTVGKGAFGTAVLYRRREDESHVILKEINLHALTGSERQLALNECQVLSILQHPNIISYYDSFEHNGTLVIEMEYADGGTLEKHLADQTEPLPEAQVVTFFRQLTSALAYIHEHR